MSRTALIMAGGTGGHIFPGLAVADHLRERGWRVVWLGAKGGMEARLVPPRGYATEWIRFSGVRKSGALRWVMLPAMLVLACIQSARVLFRQRPDVVLGMGGFVTFPGGLMASLFNRPLVIHEQNSIAGLANRVLAALADRVLTGFPEPFSAGGGSVRMLKPAREPQWCGNPVRPEIAALPAPEQRFAGRSGPLRLLVVGGSLGARALNEVVPAALKEMAQEARPKVVHQAGMNEAEALATAYREAGVAAEVLPFIDDMAARYGEADLVLCRAGALTVGELAAAGVASILVPYPHAVDDHQTHNARFLGDRGAAILLPQNELNPGRLRELIASLERGPLLAMAREARKLAKPEATRAVAQACVELAA